jgi:hypothetical protein
VACFWELVGTELENKLPRPNVEFPVEPLEDAPPLLAANKVLLTAGVALEDCTSGMAADMTAGTTPGLIVPVP